MKTNKKRGLSSPWWRLVFVANGGPDDIRCECGGALQHWDLLRSQERPKRVLCCSVLGCDNSVKKTAEIMTRGFGAKPTEPEPAEEATA